MEREKRRKKTYTHLYTIKTNFENIFLVKQKTLFQKKPNITL